MSQAHDMTGGHFPATNPGAAPGYPAAVSFPETAPVGVTADRGLFPSKGEFHRIAAPILAAGGGWPEVAAAFGLTTQQAMGRGQRMGMRSGRPRGRPLGARWNPNSRRPPGMCDSDFLAIAAPILARGGSWAEVARAVNLSEGAAWDRGTRLGLKSQNKRGGQHSELARRVALENLRKHTPEVPIPQGARHPIYRKFRKLGFSRDEAIQAALAT